ncbi:MAG: DUF3800 domain-containing protein [Methylophilaceae bacterium]
MTTIELPQQFSLFENEDDQTRKSDETIPDSKFSNYVVYVDESGDHGMQNLDENYPMFVLAFCIFHKRHYSEKVVPALQKFKFNRFGHDNVVLHETDIRKEKGSFIFPSKPHKQSFISELTSIIEQSNFILISCVIDKRALKAKSEASIPNPYHIALGFCLETLYDFLKEKGQQEKETHVVVECRGKKEDNELELEFRRICDSNRLDLILPFNVIFADKKVNSTGLQLADLVARPIGLSVLRPEQENSAFQVLKRKFYCSGGRHHVGIGYENWGLKIFPQIAKSPDETHRGLDADRDPPVHLS